MNQTAQPKIVCFDLDDTLIDDSYKFEITFCDCIKTILLAFETRAPQIDEVLQLARKLDNDKMLNWPPEKRYTPERLLSTWIETYEQLSEKYKVATKPHVKLLLEGQVRQNFDPPHYIIPGAIETLENLKQDGRYTLMLVTAGTQDVQLSKAVKTDLHKFFTQVFCVINGAKKAPLGELAKKYGQRNVIMIGNSIRSDINPALEIGIKALYIPRGSWHLFKAEPVNNDFTTLENITQVPDALHQLWPELAQVI